MRRMFCSLILLATVALTLAVDLRPSDAQVIYPWCAHYLGRAMGGAPNCGFTTFAQCMATVSGLGGSCEMNPWYPPPPPVGQRPAARRRG